MRRCLPRWGLLTLALSWVGLAHTLDTATTRVTLRDGHVELDAEWDVFPLLAVTPTGLAVTSETELIAAYELLRTRLETETVLEVDGVRAPLQVRGLLAPMELRALAATLSSHGVEHGALLRLKLEATTLFPRAARLTVQAPPAIGATLVTFVQPHSQLAAPGQPAGFQVLEAGGPPATPENTAAGAWAFVGVGVMAVLAVALARWFGRTP